MRDSMRWVRSGLVVVLMTALIGCTHVPGGIAASSTPIEGKEYEVIKLVRGTDSAVRLFGILPISGSNSIRNAMDAAIKSCRADGLIEVTVEAYTQYWILFVRDVIRVEGYAFRFKRSN